MKSFNYHAPKDTKDASKLASSNSAFLAGGMTTIPSMKLGLATYKDVIDIKKNTVESKCFLLSKNFKNMFSYIVQLNHFLLHINCY